MSDFFKNIKKTAPFFPGKEFFKRTSPEWDALSERFFKYEGLQIYDEGDDGPINDYIAGDYERFVEQLVAGRRDDKTFFDECRARGATLFRIHAIRFPLSDYLKAEYYSYILSEKSGENIFQIDEAEVMEEFDILPDFLIFDHSALFVHRYDEAGVLEGAHCTEDPEAIEQAAAIYEKLRQQATPYHDMFQPDKDIVRLLEQKWNS